MFFKLIKKVGLKSSNWVKLFAGIAVGIIMSRTLLSVSFGLDTVKAIIAPTRILVHFNDGTIDVSTSEYDILYYQNKVYIPLRNFSESIGATVDYKGPETTPDGKSIINIHY